MPRIAGVVVNARHDRLAIPTRAGSGGTERAHAPSNGVEADPGGQILVALLAHSATFAGVLLTCQVGFETLLVRELAELHGLRAEESGPGWARSAVSLTALENAGSHGRSQPDRATDDLAFAHLALLSPVEIRGESVNALAARIAEFFLGAIRGERIDAAWPSLWLGPAELVGLGRRMSGVEHAFGEVLKKKLSRVARLATAELPRAIGVGPARGLFVFFTDFGRAFVAREAFVHGPRRMADDPLAPSRSYLKIEEAYVVLGRAPSPGETVADLGAAPGGWSYSAAKRGARVFAIDNGPLKGGALDHPQIEHRREDAFRFTPASAGLDRFDWLFCDLVEDPHRVRREILEPWLAQGWCRNLVVNLKFGRVDPIALLREVRGPGSLLARHAPAARVRHLFHDREEFTVAGEPN